MSRFTINSDVSLSETIGAIRAEYEAKKYLTVITNSGKKRTSSLNSLLYAWLVCICKERGEHFPAELKCIFKLHRGLPLLRGMPEEEKSADVLTLCAFCDSTLDHMPYEQKLAVMEYMPCTSLMSTVQFIMFLTEIQFLAADKHGIVLYWPDEYQEMFKKEYEQIEKDRIEKENSLKEQYPTEEQV